MLYPVPYLTLHGQQNILLGRRPVSQLFALYMLPPPWLMNRCVQHPFGCMQQNVVAEPAACMSPIVPLLSASSLMMRPLFPNRVTPSIRSSQLLTVFIPKFPPSPPDVPLQTLAKVSELTLRSHLTFGCYLVCSTHRCPDLVAVTSLFYTPRPIGLKCSGVMHYSALRPVQRRTPDALVEVSGALNLKRRPWLGLSPELMVSPNLSLPGGTMELHLLLCPCPPLRRPP